MAEPPPFREANRCDICKCSFNTFRRRHHCRCCGRTLCNEHSSNQMVLPQFGIHFNVRVCQDCFNNSSRSEKHDPQTSSEAIGATTNAFSWLDIGEGVAIKAESAVAQSSLVFPECKCGMPLCICEAPATDPPPMQVHSTPTSAMQANPKLKKVVTPSTADSISKNMGSSNSKPSLFFSLGQATNGSLGKPSANYEVNGEGLREAIKSNDAKAVKKLLSEGVDANFCDKQGLSLLHLAALFNHTEIAFILIDHGASLDCKNAQGETPLDCAPTMLQYKMRQKMEGGM